MASNAIDTSIMSPDIISMQITTPDIGSSCISSFSCESKINCKNLIETKVLHGVSLSEATSRVAKSRLRPRPEIRPRAAWRSTSGTQPGWLPC